MSIILLKSLKELYESQTTPLFKIRRRRRVSGTKKSWAKYRIKRELGKRRQRRRGKLRLDLSKKRNDFVKKFKKRYNFSR